DIVSIKEGSIKSWDEKNWGESIPVDKLVQNTQASNYDALILPGGVINPDSLRTNEDALSFIRDFFREGKPVAAICHAPWLLISAGVIEKTGKSPHFTASKPMLSMPGVIGEMKKWLLILDW